ncbi:fimbrial protein [Enterobacter asburiae]|uniref:fimbrial protein n=1 Tax=Enterobacter asburiae TaxID=61645 RepID=UPI003AFADAC4
MQLFGPDGNKLDVEKESSKQILSNGTNKIPMSVNYVTTADSATAGAVESVATFQITYS